MHSITMTKGGAGCTHDGSIRLIKDPTRTELGHIANGISHELIMNRRTDVYERLRR